MSLELARRLKSTLVMVSAVIVTAIAAGAIAVIQDQSFVSFLLEKGLNQEIISLIVVFLYQVFAYILNKYPVPTLLDGKTAGENITKEKILI